MANYIIDHTIPLHTKNILAGIGKICDTYKDNPVWVTPKSWRPYLKYPNGKANRLAEEVLSGIVFNYRTADIKDKDGVIVGWAKYFEGDLLQKTHKQLMKEHDCTLIQLTDTLEFLEKRGCIKRHLRHDIKLGNVLFIEPVIQTLEKFTPPIDGSNLSNTYTIVFDNREDN